MQDTAQEVSISSVEQVRGFNYNKLQAALCIASSAAVSTGLIIWAIKAFF